MHLLILFSTPPGITSCLRIPPSPHLFINGSDFSFGSSVNFACENGYTLQGSTTIYCLNDGEWRGTIPHCVPRLVQCSPLNLHPNITLNTTATTNGTVVKVSCPDGYHLQGIPFLMCMANGQWNSSLPTCVAPPNQCSDIKVGDHVHKSNSSREFGSTVKFSCAAGYRLVGSQMVTCLTNGSWNASFPQCDLIKCSALSDIEHGNWSASNSFNVGSKVTFTCEDGYTLQGHLNTTCLQTGKWSVGVPACIPTSAVTKCQQKTCDKHATCKGNITIGSNVTVICDDGYKLQGNHTLTCLKTGNWSAPFPLCVLITCPSFKLDHGKLNTSGTVPVGSKATVTCDDGYILQGQSSMTCMKTGSWSTASVSCVSTKSKQSDSGGSRWILMWRKVGMRFLVQDCMVHTPKHVTFEIHACQLSPSLYTGV